MTTRKGDWRCTMLFDWQPITTENIIGAAVGIVATITMIFLILGFRESRKSAEAAQRSAKIAQQTAELALSDSDSRNRPWIMLNDCGLRDNSESLDHDVLSLDFKNVGMMPARNVGLSLSFHVSKQQWEQQIDGELRESVPLIAHSNRSIGTAFPDEPINFKMEFEAGSKWRIYDLDVFMAGSVDYEYGEKHYHTGFEGNFTFLNKRNVLREWRHLDVT